MRAGAGARDAGAGAPAGGAPGHRRRPSRLESAIARLPDEEIADDVRYATLSAAGDLEHLRRLREAFRERREVRLTLPEGRRRSSRRTGSSAPPASCSPAGCGTRWPTARAADGVRIFRLDRVEEVESLEARSSRPEDNSLETVIGDGRAFQSSRVRQPSESAIRPGSRAGSRSGKGSRWRRTGRSRMEHPLADTDWAVRHVLQYGPDATVLEPAEVREAVVQRLGQMAAS